MLQRAYDFWPYLALYPPILDLQVCLWIGKIPLFIEKIILIRIRKKPALDYLISAVYQINVQFEMTPRDILTLTNNKNTLLPATFKC